jgi:hypothetical protein
VVSFADVLMAPILVDVLPRVVESLPLLNAAYYLDILVGLLLVPWYVRASRRNPRLDRRSLTRVSVGVLGAGRVLAVPTARAVLSGRRAFRGGWPSSNTARLGCGG